MTEMLGVEGFKAEEMNPGYQCEICGQVLTLFAPGLDHETWRDAMHAAMVDHLKGFHTRV